MVGGCLLATGIAVEDFLRLRAGTIILRLFSAGLRRGSPIPGLIGRSCCRQGKKLVLAFAWARLDDDAPIFCTELTVINQTGCSALLAARKIV